MSSKTKYVLAMALAVVAIGFLSYRTINHEASAKVRRPGAPLVKVESPTRDSVQYVLEFNGDVIPIQQAGVYSKVTGNLNQVYVNMGDAVRNGQTLALIDTTLLYQNYQQAAATNSNARMVYERTKDLYEKSLAAKQDLDNADAAYKVASAGYELALTNLGYAKITAPFAGIITKRYLDPGAVVTTNNATLFDLMDLDSMKVVVNILEKDIPRVGRGTRAVISVDAFPERQFFGSVTRLSQAVDPASRTMAVEIDIPNSDHALKPGMFSHVVLVIGGNPNALLLPSQSILRDDQGNYVFTASGDTARVARITTGVDKAARTEIISGIAANDKVIVVGQQLVKANGPISIQQ